MNLFRHKTTVHDIRKDFLQLQQHFPGHNFHAGWCTSPRCLSYTATSKTTFHSCTRDQRSFSAWCPRSPVITPCDMCLYGFLKDTLHRRRPASVLNLKDSIRRYILDILLDSLCSPMVLRFEHIIQNEWIHIA